jgi:predicted nucleic acid-binding protein
VGLKQDIGNGPVGLDTVLFIYLIEEHSTYFPLVGPVFEAIEGGKSVGVTSSLTLLEVLVVPYRTGNQHLAEQYEALLTRSRGLRFLELNRALLRAAAQMRAVYPALRTPDAIQIAASMACGCTTFLTNNRSLPSIPGIRVLQLRDYLRA